MTERPDYAELIRSPYDDDGGAPNRRKTWLVVPIIAVATGGFLGFAASGEQSDPPAEVSIADGSTTTTSLADAITPVPSTGFPAGFVPISDDVAVAPFTTYMVEGDSYVVVASAARGSAERDVTFMQSIGEWVLRNPSGDVPMVSQVVNDFIVPGMTQIRFPGRIEDGAVLVAAPVEGFSAHTVRLFDDVPTEMTVPDPVEFVADGVPVVLNDLSWSLTRGYSAWLSPTATPITVEVIVSLLGTEGDGRGDLPIRVTSNETFGVMLATEERVDVPAWNTHGQLVLNRDGAFRFDEDEIVSVVVDAVVQVPSGLASPIEIPLP